MKILMVIAKEGFRDEEFKEPYEIFKNNGIEVDIASTESGKCTGKFGTEVNANTSIKEVSEQSIDKYSSILLVGGPGSKTLVGNEVLEKILSNFENKKKIVSAICFAPVILAKSGLLKGKNATVWNKDGNQLPIFKNEGVNYIEKPVVKDGLFITADGASSATAFGKEIVSNLGV